VVLGRSKTVGTPIFELFKWKSALVTVCHSETQNLKAVVRNRFPSDCHVSILNVNCLLFQLAVADILVVAIDQPRFVKGDWIKPGAVVIDCGTHSIPGKSRKTQKIVRVLYHLICIKMKRNPE
jgi:methylenetetrahydrofolate dehydrogenase (NADP+) / methenyltetrahydrofolate cyclohydrolase / formyltetrahydrofolate synthetase